MTATDLLLSLAALHGSILLAIDEEQILDRDDLGADLVMLADEVSMIALATDDDGWAAAWDVEPVALDRLWDAGILTAEPARSDCGRYVRIEIA